MCEFNDSNCKVFGDIWWTDKFIYVCSIEDSSPRGPSMYAINYLSIMCMLVELIYSSE